MQSESSPHSPQLEKSPYSNKDPEQLTNKFLLNNFFKRLRDVPKVTGPISACSRIQTQNPCFEQFCHFHRK